jgi:hypothetical protein
LYLAREAATAGRECSGQTDACDVWVQEFAIDLPDQRAIHLELDMERTAPYLHYLLLDSEYLPDVTAEFANVRNPYRATHLLTYLCERLEITAVEYPSVRGVSGSGANSVNLVVMGDPVSIAQRMQVGLPVQFEDR